MSTSPFLAGRILFAARWVETSLLALLSEAGWQATGTTHSAVFGLIDSEGTSISDLARRIGVTRQSMHQTVREMRRFGVVDLVDHPTDGRTKLVMLTEDGWRQVADAHRLFTALETEIERRIGPRAMGGLRRALDADWGSPPTGEDELGAGTRPRRPNP